MSVAVMLPETRVFSTSACRASEMIHIALVEAHALVRLGLIRVLDGLPSMVVTLEANTTQEFLKGAIKHLPDVVVLGPSVPIGDCLQLIEALRDSEESLPGVVVMQTRVHPDVVLPLLGRGIHALLDDSSLETDFVSALTAAASGSRFMGMNVYKLFEAARVRTSDRLTPRELEILSLLTSGASNRQLARTLRLKEKTIEAHLTRIYSKLGVQSRAEAIIHGLRFLPNDAQRTVHAAERLAFR